MWLWSQTCEQNCEQNHEKTNFMIFSNKGKKKPTDESNNKDGNEVKRLRETKLLGVMADEKICRRAVQRETSYH